MAPSGETRGATNRFSCLVVEDDTAFAMMASKVVQEEGGDPTHVATLAAAREMVARRPHDLVLLDNHLPDGKGYDFFEQLARRNPEAPIIMITGLPDLGEAITLTRNGLFDYLTKPLEVNALAACLRRARLRLQARGAEPAATELLGTSAAMQEIQRQLRQAAQHAGSTVLLTGETGSGKDVAARALHALSSPQGERPFVAVNCATMPADMFEAELFGAEKGAYTGADHKRVGLVEAAGGGTLFLDEIAEVPVALQAKLLRLLEGHEYRPLGSTEARAFKGRFVAATNKHLPDEVQAGRFREDLMYRLDVFSVALPPLRERREDIPGLAESLLAQLAKRYDRARPHLKPGDLEALTRHAFPGNVRELRNILERSLLRTDPEARWLAIDSSWLARSSSGAATARVAPSSAEPIPGDRDLSPLEEQEYRLIREILRETKGGIRRSAAKLGMSPQSLLRRLEKWPELRIEKG